MAAGPERVVEADAHFMSVDAVRCSLGCASSRYMHLLSHYEACIHLHPPRAHRRTGSKADIYLFGDVKGKTKRFCGDGLKQRCGINPGNWSIMSTVLESGHKVYGIGHRRGGE
eukprot:6186742-Pleurochrysis_carterae.AAC.1